MLYLIGQACVRSSALTTNGPLNVVTVVSLFQGALQGPLNLCHHPPPHLGLQSAWCFPPLELLRLCLYEPQLHLVVCHKLEVILLFLTRLAEWLLTSDWENKKENILPKVKYVPCNKGFNDIGSHSVVMVSNTKLFIVIECNYMISFPESYLTDLLNQYINWLWLVSLVLYLSINNLSGLLLGF